MSGALTGLGLGALTGGGLFLVATGTPWSRRPTLDARLGPYLRDAPRPSRLLQREQALTPFPTLERLLRPVLGDLMKGVERWVGGLTSVRRRLEQTGREMSVEQFRAEQVLWGGFGLAAALGLALLLFLSGKGSNPITLLVSAAMFTVLGVLGRDRWLTRQVTERETRMLEEFPTVAELLALAVTAGEGPIGALERVTRIAGGELSRSWRGRWPTPGPAPPSSRRSRASPRAPRWRRWPGSSTASRSRSSGVPRWPRCCGRRRSMCARPASASCSSPPGAGRSR